MNAAAPEAVDPFELTIDENLLPPKTGNKQREALRQRMNAETGDVILVVATTAWW